jgi:glutamine synthetase
VDYKGVCPAYDVDLTLRSMPFLEQISRYMNQLDWGVYSFDQEGGNGQYEFDFAYADALMMADRFVFLRFMAKTIAQSVGAIATFMPKPFSDDFRSAAHFNMSLADRTGKNIFEPEQTQTNAYESIAPLTLNFVAGLLQHAPALTAITCPTFNSYKGLIPQGDMKDISWAPVLQTYGRNNRSAMLRIPMNRYCIENRAPDISCNPYLAAAFSLAAGMEGIEKDLDPGPALSGNLYDLVDVDNASADGAEIRRLPLTLLDSLAAFAADPLVTQVFGKEFQQIYLNQKRKEWDRAFYKVSDEEREQMLTFV